MEENFFDKQQKSLNAEPKEMSIDKKQIYLYM